MLGNLFLKQKMMNRVLIALIPIIIFAVFLFGWRIPVVIFVYGFLLLDAGIFNLS